MPLACASDPSTSVAALAEHHSQTASPSLTTSQQAPADDAAHAERRPNSAPVDDGDTESVAAGAQDSAAGGGPVAMHSQQDRGATTTAGLAPGNSGGEGPANARSEVPDSAAQQQRRRGALGAGGSSAQEPGARARRQHHILARLAEMCGDDTDGTQGQAAAPATPARQHRGPLSQPELSSGLRSPRAVHSAGFQRQRRERQLERLLSAVEAHPSQRLDEADGGAPGSVPARHLSGAGRRRLSDVLERARSVLEPHAALLREVAQPHSGSGSRLTVAPSPAISDAAHDVLQRRRSSRHAGESPTLRPRYSAPAAAVPHSLRTVDLNAVGVVRTRPGSPHTEAAAVGLIVAAEPAAVPEGDSAIYNSSEAALEAIAAAEATAMGNSSPAAALDAMATIEGIVMGAMGGTADATGTDPAQPSVAAAAADAGHAVNDVPPVPESSLEMESSSGIIVAGESGSDSDAPGSASDAATEPEPQEGPPPDTATDDDGDLILLPPPEPTRIDLTVLVGCLAARSYSCVGFITNSGDETRRCLASEADGTCSGVSCRAPESVLNGTVFTVQSSDSEDAPLMLRTKRRSPASQAAVRAQM